MNSLQQLKYQINELRKFNVIAEALKQIASGQMTTKKRRASISSTILDSFRFMTRAMTLNRKSELHIFLSCDQRFCRLFLRPLNDYFLKLIPALSGQKEGYEYIEFSTNKIPTKEVFGQPQIANFLDGVPQYVNQITLEKQSYSAKDSAIHILICGIQSHKVAQSIPEGIGFTKKKSIANFEEAYNIAQELWAGEARSPQSPETKSPETKSPETKSPETKSYDEIYIHVNTAMDGIISYKSGFHYSLQPVAHLAQEIYFYANTSSAKENEIRMTIMAEAADNSTKEAQKTKSKFNQQRQSAITAAIMLGS